MTELQELAFITGRSFDSGAKAIEHYENSSYVNNKHMIGDKRGINLYVGRIIGGGSSITLSAPEGSFLSVPGSYSVFMRAESSEAFLFIGYRLTLVSLKKKPLVRLITSHEFVDFTNHGPENHYYYCRLRVGGFNEGQIPSGAGEDNELLPGVYRFLYNVVSPYPADIAANVNQYLYTPVGQHFMFWSDDASGTY